MENQTNETPQTADSTVNEEKLKFYKEKLKLEQNLIMGLTAGAVAAVIGAILWAVVTVATGYQIGYMAVGIGLMVGFSVRFMGKGIDQIFGISGAILALLGCVAGNILCMVAPIADMGIGYFDALSMMSWELIQVSLVETFSPMDVVFYAIAIYEGYKFSFRQITEEEIMANTASN